MLSQRTGRGSLVPKVLVANADKITEVARKHLRKSLGEVEAALNRPGARARRTR
jgi:hypothetical protein